MLFGYFFSTLRISTGDFDFNASTYLSTEENIVYWVIWMLTVYTTTIIFLNFIIAEVGDSYAKVKENMDALLAKEKTALVQEAETMLFKSDRTEVNFPRYIVVREIET